MLLKHLFFLIGCIVLVYLFFKTKNGYKIKMMDFHKMEFMEKNEAEIFYLFKQSFILILLFFCLIFLVGKLISTLQWLIDPELYAFQKFLNMIK